MYLTPYTVNANGQRTYDGYGTPRSLSGRYVRITAQQIGLILDEVIFRLENQTVLPAQVVSRVHANEASTLFSDPENLLDEQDTLEGEPIWYNSTYFDEIYHARTAFELLNGTSVYEWTHPPLGKAVSYTHLDVYKRQALDDVLYAFFALPPSRNVYDIIRYFSP